MVSAVMARPTATRPPTTSDSLVWALMPSPPPDDGPVVVAVEPGTSWFGAVVVGAAVVEVVDVAFVVVVVVDLAFVVVVVDLGLVVVVVGFFVVVVALLVVVDCAVVEVSALVEVVDGSAWRTPAGSSAAVWAEPGSIHVTPSATTTAAAATAMERLRT